MTRPTRAEHCPPEATTKCRLLLLLLLLLWCVAAAVAQPGQQQQPQPQCTTSDVSLSGGLRTVTCNRVQLDSVPDAQLAPAGTEVLVLPNNRIAALSHASLARLAGSLQELDLTNNYLDGIPPDLFANLTKLRKVDLSRNRLRRMPQGFITTAPYVEELILARNQFPVLPSRFLQGMPRLRRLVLADCSIEEIQPDAFVALAAPALAELDISGNMLEQLEARVEADIFKPALTTVRLYENFWRCDCKLRWLRSAVDARKVKWTFDGDTYVPKCEEPKKLKHKSWQLATEADFGCKPSIVDQRAKRQRFLPGMRMTLSCAFDSDPPATVRWSHDGASLDTAHRYAFNAVQNGTVVTALLSVPSATARDEGVYTCTAASSFGMDNASITVSVSAAGDLDEAAEDHGAMPVTTIVAIAVVGVAVIIAVVAGAYCAYRRIVHRGTYLNAKDEGMPMLVQSPSSGSAYPTALAISNDDYMPPHEHEASLAVGEAHTPAQPLLAKGGGAMAMPPDIIKHYPEEPESLMRHEPMAQLTAVAPLVADPVSEYPHDDAGYREYNAYLAMIAEPQAIAAATGGDDGDDDDEDGVGRLAEVEPEFAPGLHGATAAAAVGATDGASPYHHRAAAAAATGASIAVQPPHPRTMAQPAAPAAAQQQPNGAASALSHGSTLNTIPEENSL